MLTLLIGILGAAALCLLSASLFDSVILMVLLGIIGFLLATLPINLWVKRRLEAVFRGVQARIEAQQDVLRRKVNMMSNKMMSSTKGVQKQLEKQQTEAIRAALVDLDQVDALRKWNVLAERQANTLRAQLCFQIQDFQQADIYFKNSLALDPLTVCMKMVRFYKRDERTQLEKLYRKATRRFKGGKATLVYALYTWILVREKEIDKAIKILVEAKDKTDDETLKANWECLVNGRSGAFSNAGLGDMWYALQLETPKPVRAKQQHIGGGKRRR